MFLVIRWFFSFDGCFGIYLPAGEETCIRKRCRCNGEGKVFSSHFMEVDFAVSRFYLGTGGQVGSRPVSCRLHRMPAGREVDAL